MTGALPGHLGRRPKMPKQVVGQLEKPRPNCGPSETRALVPSWRCSGRARHMHRRRSCSVQAIPRAPALVRQPSSDASAARVHVVRASSNARRGGVLALARGSAVLHGRGQAGAPAHRAAGRGAPQGSRVCCVDASSQPVAARWMGPAAECRLERVQEVRGGGWQAASVFVGRSMDVVVAAARSCAPSFHRDRRGGPRAPGFPRPAG